MIRRGGKQAAVIYRPITIKKALKEPEKTFAAKVRDVFPSVLTTAMVGFVSGLTSSAANNIFQGRMNWTSWKEQHSVEFATKSYWDEISLLREVNSAYRDWVFFDNQMEIEQRYRIMRLAIRMAFPNKTIDLGSFGVSITEQPTLEQFRKLADYTSKLETAVSALGIYFGPKVDEDARNFMYMVRNAPVAQVDPGPLAEKLKNVDTSNSSAVMAILVKYVFDIAPQTNFTAQPFGVLMSDMRTSINAQRKAATSIEER